MASIKDQAAEALFGTENEQQLSQQTRANFFKHALTDPETGEKYLGEAEFLNAVAPAQEDYVRESRARAHRTRAG